MIYFLKEAQTLRKFQSKCKINASIRDQPLSGGGLTAKTNSPAKTRRTTEKIQRNTSGSSLGIFRSQSIRQQPITRESFPSQTYLRNKSYGNRCTQTVLSFPISTANSHLRRTICDVEVSYSITILVNRN